MRSFFLFLITVYQWFATPIFGGACRFYPSCSSYAKEAIEKKGSWVGFLRTTKRILKCHPFCVGGYDPVE